MTTRQEKVNSLLQREISDYLRREDYEGITGFLTITQVEVSADLEHAKVFFAVVGQPLPEVQKLLQRHIHEIQSMLLRRLEMRKVPRIEFVPDTSGEYAQSIGKLIGRLKKDAARD